MANHQAQGSRFMGAGHSYYDDEDDDSPSQAHDGIRRNYIHQSGSNQMESANYQANVHSADPNDQPDGWANKIDTTIHVKLNEGYFASERQAVVNLLSNLRQKCSSVQMFNPAKNQSINEQQQEWNEKENYTLDSLNEIKDPIDEQFQWTRPEDGRTVWGSKMQYFLAITSYSIGLGNVIRFPILVQKNGGLAFIIPFVIMLIVEELAVGQRMRKAAISCWNLVSPAAAGIGIASAVVSFIVGHYYNTMVAWTLLYLWGSATKRPLPYSECPEQEVGHKGTGSNLNSTVDESPCQRAGSYQYYWYKETLEASESVDQWTSFNLPVFVCLLVAWFLSYYCLSKGLTSSKRVVYVASVFPYVILTVFFFKALTLEGMSDGIYYFFAPEWSKLYEPYVWLQSAAQVFFSLGLGFGGLIALSSYNPVNNNCYKDAIKVSLINFTTSIYAGVVIFAILGYKAQISHKKCLVEREKLINFYLSDYNLKVIKYGSVFPYNGLVNDTESSGQDLVAEQLDDDNDYDISQALASIRSLDNELEARLATGESAPPSDSDDEFIVDVSGLISERDMDKVIQQIPGLPRCSLRQELDMATQGTGLVFVVMAEAMSQFESAPAWATAFFLMLLTLGLDSQLGNLEGLLSSLADLNLANSINRRMATGLICGLSLCISMLMFANGAGSYMFAIFDDYAASFSLVIIALFELIAIGHIYGLKRFSDDCELMTGKRPPFLILLSWRYISPILLLIVMLATMREFTGSQGYEAWLVDHLEWRLWPSWCITLAAVLVLSCVLWIPLNACLSYLKLNLIPEESLSQRWFPAEELREFHDLQVEHKVTRLERILFGFRSDDD